VSQPGPRDWFFRLKRMLDSDVLLAGRGYWIEVPEDVVWTIVN